MNFNQLIIIVSSLLAALSLAPTHDDTKEAAAWKAHRKAVPTHQYQKTGRMIRAAAKPWDAALEDMNSAIGAVAGCKAEPLLLYTRAHHLFAADRFADASDALADLKKRFPEHGLCKVIAAGDESGLSMVDAAIRDCEIEIEIRAKHKIAPMPKAVLDDKQSAIIHTDLGDITIGFYSSVAPTIVANFKKLCAAGFYNDTYVHRVLPLQRIEMGCPNTHRDNRPRQDDGFGSPGYDMPLELSDASHVEGTVSMLRIPGTNRAHGSQFTICVIAQPELDDQQPIFARVIGGLDVLKKISQQRADDQDNPYDHVFIRGIEWQEKH